MRMALTTYAVPVCLGVALSVPVKAASDNARSGANATAQAKAARDIRNDLNRRQIEMSRMQRLQANQAIRDRAASGITSSPYVDSCSYQFRRWRQTRSTYWRDRYYDCVD